MNRLRLPILAALALPVALAGCAGNGALARGRMAEQRGEPDKAYRLYCEAAETYPSSGSLRGALARVSGPAAQTWLNRGEQYELRRRYGLAWRCFMAALTIRPDDRRALAGVRRLERNHVDDLRDVQTAWLRHGEQSLWVADVDTDAAVASAKPTRATEELERPAPEREESVPPEPDHVVDAMPTRAPEPTPPPRPAVQPAVEEEPEPRAVAPKEEPASPRAREFLMTAVVSREDKRYRKMAPLVDGIRVRVRDTDSDPNADVDVYRGRRRVKKVRNWQVGESVRVSGYSGRTYDLVLLSVVHKTESVRVGVRHTLKRGTDTR